MRKFLIGFLMCWPALLHAQSVTNPYSATYVSSPVYFNPGGGLPVTQINPTNFVTAQTAAQFAANLGGTVIPLYNQSPSGTNFFTSNGTVVPVYEVQLANGQIIDWGTLSYTVGLIANDGVAGVLIAAQTLVTQNGITGVTPQALVGGQTPLSNAIFNATSNGGTSSPVMTMNQVNEIENLNGSVYNPATGQYQYTPGEAAAAGAAQGAMTTPLYKAYNACEAAQCTKAGGQWNYEMVAYVCTIPPPNPDPCETTLINGLNAGESNLINGTNSSQPAASCGKETPEPAAPTCSGTTAVTTSYYGCTGSCAGTIACCGTKTSDSCNYDGPQSIVPGALPSTAGYCQTNTCQTNAPSCAPTPIRKSLPTPQTTNPTSPQTTNPVSPETTPVIRAPIGRALIERRAGL